MTRQQARTLDFIKGYSEANGHAPTYEQIGAHLGIVKSGVHRIVKALRERGHVAARFRKARSVSIADEPGLLVRLPRDLSDLLDKRCAQYGAPAEELVAVALASYLMCEDFEYARAL